MQQKKGNSNQDILRKQLVYLFPVKKNSKIRHLLLKSLKYDIFAENMEARHIFIWCPHVYYLKNSVLMQQEW